MTAGPSVLEQNRFAYEPGDVIASKYALEQVLGSGGMGAVFRARNTVIDMPVAIKLIRADLDRDLFSDRLLQEARAAAKLSHPAIVRVFDVGQTALGDPFIVMELLEGEALSGTIEREGRLTGVRAVQLLLPIADALSMAHAKGFVHRDVKPDNVFIATDAEGHLQPKLVDFGIVKQDERGTDPHDSQGGAVVGSPDYMSPEQARGLADIDSRSDVWSFSVVLYESIYGRAPFDGDSYQVLMENVVVQEPVTLRELSVADETLSSIVSKGMSKDRAERWQSLGQMGKALAHWLYEQGISEDACGASLESRWLSRSTDPSALSRAARTSSPESWPEPPSGVRAVGKLGFAPTVRVSNSAGTPHALSQTSAPPPNRKKRVTLALGGSALALCALGGAFVWSRSTHDAAADIVVATPPKATSEARRDALPAPEVSAAAPSAAPPVASASVAPPVKRRPVAAPARRPQRKKSSSDLLAPY